MQSNFLDWLKKFGPAQNILGPVKGQGIREVRIQKCLFRQKWKIPSIVPSPAFYTNIIAGAKLCNLREKMALLGIFFSSRYPCAIGHFSVTGAAFNDTV